MGVINLNICVYAKNDHVLLTQVQFVDLTISLEVVMTQKG